MSKLYNKYLNLKEMDSSKLYLFKNGIFYIFISDDAVSVSETLGLKLTNLNASVVKCGFPYSKLSDYMEKLNSKNLDFQIIDENLNSVTNEQKYVNNVSVTNIIDTIKKTDMEKITPMQAFTMLNNFKNILTNSRN